MYYVGQNKNLHLQYLSHEKEKKPTPKKSANENRLLAIYKIVDVW